MSNRQPRSYALSERDFESQELDSLSNEIDLNHYLRVMRKHKFPIVLFTAAVTALSAYYAFTATPIYKSTATLIIETDSANPIGFEQLVGLGTESQDYRATQYELLSSRTLAVRAVNKMNLWQDPRFNRDRANELAAPEVDSLTPAESETQPGESLPLVVQVKQFFGIDTVPVEFPASSFGNSPVNGDTSYGATIDSGVVSQNEFSDFLGNSDQLTLEQQAVVGRFRSGITVTPIRRTNLVTISYEFDDRVFAAQAANTIAEEYINGTIDSKLDLTARASLRMNERLGELAASLDTSEQKLIAYKRENGLVDVQGSVGRITEQEVMLATTELAQARSDLAIKEDIYNEVRSLGNDQDLLASLPVFQSDPLIQRVRIDQGVAQRNLDELLNRYGDKHPRVVDAQSQLLTLSSTLAGHISRVVGRVTKDFQLAQSRVASTQAKLNQGKQEIGLIGSKSFELSSLEREVETKRVIYDTFFSRINEAASADGMEEANARVTDYALPANRAFKPKKELIVALAALGSLVLSMLMAFLYEHTDRTIKSSKDIERELGIAVLGIIPLLKKGAFGLGKDSPVVPGTDNQKNRAFTEAVNTIRTAISLGEEADSQKTVTITSSVPGEGKSVTALNLAYSLAQLNRVLLIDCDMRRPTIAKSLGFESDDIGLSDILSGGATARECLKKGVIEGRLDVIPSGPNPIRPLELLSSGYFQQLLDEIEGDYDKIILDCPPVHAVSDALVIARMSDTVLYVVKSNDTSMEIVKAGTGRLEQLGTHVTGVIISQVDIEKISAYAGDHYYQGLYDYYDYREEESSSFGRADKKKPKRKVRERREVTEPVHQETYIDELDKTTRLPTNETGYNGKTAKQQVNSRANRFDSIDKDLDFL